MINWRIKFKVLYLIKLNLIALQVVEVLHLEHLRDNLRLKNNQFISIQMRVEIVFKEIEQKLSNQIEIWCLNFKI